MKTLSNVSHPKDILPLRSRMNFICEFYKPKIKKINTRITIYRGGRTRPHHIHFYKGNNFVQMFKSNSTRYFINGQESYSIKSANILLDAKFIKDTSDIYGDSYVY